MSPDVTRTCSVEGCERARNQRRRLCSMHSSRWDRHGDLLADKKWVGDKAGYWGVHKRLARRRGSASGYACVDCGAPAQEWSYNHAAADEKCDERGQPYSTNLDDYDPRCKPCHGRLDKNRVLDLRGRW